MTPLNFCEKGVKTGAQVYQEDVLQGGVKPLNTTLFSGQKWVIQQDSAPAHKAKTTHAWLRRHVPAFISAENWPLGSPDLNPLDYKLWAVLEDMLAESVTTSRTVRRDPRESSGRDPPGDGACRDSSGRSISRFALRQTAATSSDIIINKNLKLLLINYLARKVDVLFHFPSRSQQTCNRTYGRTV